MDPHLFAQLHGESKKEQKELPLQGKEDELFDEGIESDFAGFMEPFLEAEKEGYQSSLVPFEQQAERMKVEAIAFFERIAAEMQRTGRLLREAFAEEEKVNPEIPEEAKFQAFERALALLNGGKVEEIIQEQLHLSWAFMDRVYRIARKAFQEKRFEEALSFFSFLRLLNNTVFEYWFGEAASCQALGLFERARDLYFMSLTYQPENALVYFELSNCFHQMQDKESCREALHMCIECAPLNDEYAVLLKEAETALTEIDKDLNRQLPEKGVAA